MKRWRYIAFCLLTLAVFLSVSAALAEITVPFGRPAMYSGTSNNFPTYNDGGGKHRGNDIQGSEYTAIFAVRSGTVRYAASDGSYGNIVSVRDAEYPSIDFRYAHMASYVVKKGDVVEAGDVIGYMGKTGNVTGVHLHLEGAWKGNATTGFSDTNLNTCFTRKSGYPGNAYNMSGNSPVLASGDVMNYRLSYNANKAPGGVLRARFNYPSNLKTGNSWVLKGAVVSPNTLTYVDVWIENANGTRVAGMTSPKNPGNYFFDIHSIDSQVKMQNVSSNGTYYFCIRAQDNSGNELNVRQAFTASSNATSEKTATYSISSSIVSVQRIDLAANYGFALSDGGYQLNPAITPSNATNQTLSWSSSNTSVATVNSTGYVTFTGIGTAVITAAATDGSGVSTTVNLTVSNGISMVLGTKYWLDVSIGSAASLNWLSSDTSVVNVSGDGYLNGVGTGTAVVTIADANNPNNSTQCSVTVNAPSSVDAYVGVSGNGTAISLDGTDGRCARIYSFVTTATAYYDFYTLGSSDSYGILYDANWNVIASDDDSGQGNNFNISAFLNGGDLYYILVRGVSPQQPLASTLYTHYKVLCELAEDQQMSINIDIPGWNYFSSFIPNENGTYAFVSSGSQDTYGSIYGSNFNVLASDDDGGDDANFCVVCDLTAGQTYYLGCRLYYLTNTGVFDFKVCKYIPAANLSYYNVELEPGEYGQIHCDVYGEEYQDLATVQGFYADAYEDDLISVTSNGMVYGKSNGAAYVTVRSEENPEISSTVRILIHDPISYTYTSSVDTDGVISLTFTDSENITDMISGFALYSQDDNCPFDLVEAVLPGYQGTIPSPIVEEWGAGQIILFNDPYCCAMEANQTVIFRFIPRNMSGLWETTQTYSFFMYPYYGSSPIERARLDFVITVAFPDESTPLTHPDFTLPAATKVIESEAFFGSLAKRVKLPEGVTQIGNKAFANCPNLKQIYIPAGCTNIATDAFDGVENLVIFAPVGSYAEYYANRFGFECVNTDN